MSTFAICRSASVIAISTCLAAPCFAQAEATPVADEEEIIVTGIRASLEAAMDIKRESTGVVDAISAEDIGKFPDTNIAESLQRIPGVSIDRVNGEGSKVTVRGFGPQFNLITLNGRQLATSSVGVVGGDQDVENQQPTSRSFDFSNLAPEGVRTLEVYKTARTALPSGGIGATINIRTQRPLETGETGLRGSVGAKAVYDTSVDGFEVTPEFSGIVGWSNDSETFGVSLFGSYQDRKSAAPSATSNDWNIRTFGDFLNPDNGFVRRDGTTQIENAPTDLSTLVAVPNDSRYHYSESQRERINGLLTLQFKPMETLTLTADALYAQNKVKEERSDQGNWFNRPFNQVRFDDNPTVATTVFLQETLTGVKDIGFEQQYRATKSDLYSFGFNANWEISDGFTLTLDANTSKAKDRPDSPNGASSTLVGIGAPVVSAHSVDYSGAIPVQEWTLNDALRGNNNGVLDIGDLGTQVARTVTARQEHRINQFAADLGWEFDGGGRFDLGVNYIDSKMESQRSQTQQTLGDWGINNVGDVSALAGDLIEQFCMACKFDHYKPGNAAIAFRGNAVDLYEVLSAAYLTDADPRDPDLDDADPNTPGQQGRPIDATAGLDDEVKEKIWAGYVQFTWKGEFMGRPAGVVAGVRYENTKVTSNSLIRQPARIAWVADNDFTTVLSDDVVPIQAEGEYNNLLPAIDFQIEPMDNLLARVSYSRTLARPDYGNLFASVSVDNNNPNRPTAAGGVATANAGNPSLKPLVSDNFDVSLEWYFDKSSYISAAFFYKKVKNFPGAGQVEQELFGLRDPSSGAAGTRSGAALAELQRLGLDTSDVNLFTMTALIVEQGGGIDPTTVANASAVFQANLTGGSLNQTFVDQVLGRTDVIANSSDPLFNFSVDTPVNTETGNIHGFELQGQYFFGDSGFGIAGSYTNVNGDVGFDIGADPNTDQFALTGLANSYNITGIFEKYGVSARVAYNWRDKYLSRLNRQGSRNPVFVAPFGTLDVSVTYDVTENIQVSFEGVNLLSEPIRTYARDRDELWFAQELSPRFYLGARYRF
ncbi:TonB-dependent receptor [Sphingomonas cavernae]|uniref:TonB-dependent receptor n=2 Tax=Sphingomonas cavernae TaxID=2320861 RepID=A0A418WNE8_9SPHN|nr:TonB-dependent receptor [Sphingomonas cavernae]